VTIKRLEIWSDSFKEGEWFLENLAIVYPGTYQRVYRHNFQPVYTFYEDSRPRFEAIVYGDYRGWEPLPELVKEVISYGKPDIILFDRDNNKILIGIEETAAVPTGNQSLQRLERVLFSAQKKIPFIYLVSEFGLHKDGGLRRSSIWPSYLALKLSTQFQVPSLTLLYSDREHPEDYDYGSGVRDLANISCIYILEWLGNEVRSQKEEALARIFKEMGEFILSHTGEISPNLPGRALLTDASFLSLVAERTAEHDASTN
jgi:hypothetical protein